MKPCKTFKPLNLFSFQMSNKKEGFLIFIFLYTFLHFKRRKKEGDKKGVKKK